MLYFFPLYGKAPLFFVCHKGLKPVALEPKKELFRCFRVALNNQKLKMKT